MNTLLSAVFLLNLPAIPIPRAVSPAHVPGRSQQIKSSGLSNSFVVTDSLTRGAQPSADGIRELARRGIRTIVSFRATEGDDRLSSDIKVRRIHIPVYPWQLRDREVIEFLKVVLNPANQPVFIHCQHGADRTGAMCAAYRVVVQGWSKEDAIAEMVRGGYGFHSVWQNLIVYIQTMNVDLIRKQVS